MKSTKNLPPKSTLILRFLPVIVAILTLPSMLTADDKKSSALPPGFDNSFRFYNEFHLKGKIAFTAKIKGFQRILLLDLGNKRISKLIDHASNNSYPSWSPKGDKIAFTSDRDGNKEIYIADSDGSSPLRLTTTSDQSEDNANWSRDDSLIAYYAGNDKSSKTAATNIFIYNRDLKHHLQLTRHSGKNSTPVISPDGNLIAYTTSRSWPGWDVCIYDFVSKTDTCPLGGTVTYCRPDFSPDGKKIAYSSGLFSSVDGYVYDLETKEHKKVIADDGNEYDLKWDHSGEYILYASDKAEHNRYDLYVIRLEDGKSSLLLSSPYSLRYPSWHQDN